MSDSAKEAAAVYNTSRDGRKVLRGYNAIDPSGHLVLIPGNLPKDPGWRYATAGDLAAKAAAAKPAPEPQPLPPSDDDDANEPA